MKNFRLLFTAGVFLISTTASAEWWGSPAGRSADPAKNPNLSIEGTFSTSSDYDFFGARVNYQLNDAVTLYGDVGQGEFLDDGTAFGAGLFYHLPNLSNSAAFLNNVDVAAQGSYHQLSGDFGVSAIAASLLFSGREAISDNGLTWYANAGFTRLEVDLPKVTTTIPFVGTFTAGGGSEDSFELHLGGGVVLPVGPGELFGGVDLIDEFIMGIGYRYAID